MATARELETYLFAEFPAQDACEWDNPGISVGFPESEVTGIALALDASPETIEAAAKLGCNVLVTHHPVFISAPDSIVDEPSSGLSSAAIVSAISNGITLIAMHTNLDRSIAAQENLASLLGATRIGPLDGGTDDAEFGSKAELDPAGNLTLLGLSKRCESAFGRVAKVWGEPSRTIGTLAIVGGSASDLASEIMASSCDCAVVGEASYHKALDIVGSGTALIELGHDVSELPILDVLRTALERDRRFCRIVRMLPGEGLWWQPRMVM
ncbi:MAG: Nif3-like dinuclear metal center hexameric protein [bacterium]|nr:Nif3-like dinuclear metal center hexameric protein [bacterium]